MLSHRNCILSTLLCVFLLTWSEAFSIVTQPTTRIVSVSNTRRFYRDEGTSSYTSTTSKIRNELKQELAVTAIDKYDFESYQSGMTTVCEDLMKQLEGYRPISHTAQDASLNARWSFVFTGEPTIGMKLITLLSRLSVGLHFIDFRDVYLEVSQQQSQVTATVDFLCFGFPILLNVLTSLRPSDDMSPTKLIEKFEGIRVCDIPLPTPPSWHNERDLEISYLDDDMMIARTAGGEPHFLLRHSLCSTDDETCDIDNSLTEFFHDARQKYGEKISRCLVDRKFGSADEGLPLLDAAQSLLNILAGKSSH